MARPSGAVWAGTRGAPTSPHRHRRGAGHGAAREDRGPALRARPLEPAPAGVGNLPARRLRRRGSGDERPPRVGRAGTGALGVLGYENATCVIRTWNA